MCLKTNNHHNHFNKPIRKQIPRQTPHRRNQLAVSIPPQDWYKVNVDAAVFKELGAYGIGVVIRNNKGLVMGAMCKKVEFPLQALEAEAKATEAGILLAWDLGLKKIIVEGDALMVTQAIGGVTAPAISILKIVEGSRELLKLFCSWKAVHTDRKNNMAAHCLARDAKNVKDCVVWVEDSPPCIVNLLGNDVSVLDASPHQ